MSNKEAIKKLIGLLMKYKKRIIIIAVCLLISTGLNMFIPILSKDIMDLGFVGRNKKLLIELVITSTVLYIFITGIGILKEILRVNISADLEYSLSESSFIHLMKLKIDYFDKKNYAEILNNINMDISNITSIADESMFFVIAQVFGITGGVLGLFIIDYKLTLLVLLFIPLKYFVTKYFAKKRKVYMDSFIEENEKYAKWFGDSVAGIHEIKLFCILHHKKDEFSKKQKKVIEKKKKMNMLSEWNIALDNIMLQFIQMIIYIVGANMVFDFKLSLGSIFAFVTYSTYVTSPISAILNIGYLLSGIIPSTKRFFEFMNLEEEREDGNLISPSLGDIQFKDVSFSYNKDKKILNKINWKIALNSKVAIIGRNGTGKSTIINILTRLQEIDNGTILLSNQNIQSIEINKYRNIYSIVSQQIYLFNDTIRNNICLYKKIDEEFLLQVIQDSGLKKFIDEVSLDYVVGQNGSMLSGGQKQKIAMARALVHDRPIIIFDEATSNMDVYTDKQISLLINTRLKNKTIILVTHKQEILKDIDNIAVLDNGDLYEGSYNELNRTNNIFREMTNIREK